VELQPSVLRRVTLIEVVPGPTGTQRRPGKDAVHTDDAALDPSDPPRTKGGRPSVEDCTGVGVEAPGEGRVPAAANDQVAPQYPVPNLPAGPHRGLEAVGGTQRPQRRRTGQQLLIRRRKEDLARIPLVERVAVGERD